MLTNRGQTKGSAAWVVAIVGVVTFIIGALLLTAVDPVMQSLFASNMWSSNTVEGTDLLRWMQSAWAFLPVAILMLILIEVWIETRQPT